MASDVDTGDAGTSTSALQLSPADRDIGIRTMLGEAANQGLDGLAGVGSVMLNRLRSGNYGRSLSEVALSKGQFEPWSSRSDELMAINPKSQQYQMAGHVLDGLASGDIPDITMGADHFYAPAAQAAMGRQPPSWARGPGLPIGGHVFYAVDGNTPPAKQPNAMGAINNAVGVKPQPAGPVMSFAEPPQAMSDADIDALYAGTGGAKAPASAVQPAPAPPSGAGPAGGTSNAAPPLTIHGPAKAAWELGADALGKGSASQPSGPMSDQDIDALYAGAPAKAGSAQAAPTSAPAPMPSADGIRDPRTGELVVAGKGLTPDSGYWDGFRNFGNGAVLGAAVPIESGVAALKEKYWNGSGLPLGQLYDQAHDTYSGARSDYQAAHPVLAPVTETAGNLLTAIPATAAGGAALGVAGGAALDGMRSLPLLARAAPYAEGAGNFLTGNATGNLLTRMGSQAVAGAGQGAAAGAMSAGLGNESIGDAALHGAKVGGGLGAVLPTLAAGGRYGYNLLTTGLAPFSEAGTDQLAQTALAGRMSGSALTGDTSEIIPGSRPTFAEAYPDANVATMQRTARDLNPAPFVQREAANNAARTDYLTHLRGTPEDIEAAETALDSNAQNTVGSLFRPGQHADGGPVLDTIDDILNGPGGKRDAVRSVLTNIRGKLLDADGEPETDPQLLYDSVRKQIGDLLDKRAATSDPAGQQASRELIQVRDSLDQSIGDAVPGFRQFLDDYSAQKRPIDAMRYLQGLNLTDAQGNITLAKVDGALKNIGKLRSANGANAAKALTEDQVGGLQSLYDDLHRQTNLGLGRSVGSPTAQNLATQPFFNALMPGNAGVFFGNVAQPEAVLGAGGAALGHAVAGNYGALVGGGAGAGVGRLVSNAMERRNDIVRNKLTGLLVNPELYDPAAALAGRNDLTVQYRTPNGLLPGAAIIRNRFLEPAGQ